MPKETQTDLFEADGVTPKVADKSAEAAEALLALERKAARAEGETAGLKAALAAKPATTKQAEKALTRQELRLKVNAGEITEDLMDDILERQLTAKLSKQVDDKVESRLSASQTTNKTQTTIDSYVEAFPAINKDGSDLRAKVEAEFQDLVKNGADSSALSTELAAIKIVCGPLKAGAGRRPAPDSHEDVGGGGGDGNERPDTQGWAKGLGPNQKKHYQKMVNNGMYKSFNDPKLKAEIALVRRAN